MSQSTFLYGVGTASQKYFTYEIPSPEFCANFVLTNGTSFNIYSIRYSIFFLTFQLECYSYAIKTRDATEWLIGAEQR